MLSAALSQAQVFNPALMLQAAAATASAPAEQMAGGVPSVAQLQAMLLGAAVSAAAANRGGGQAPSTGPAPGVGLAAPVGSTTGPAPASPWNLLTQGAASPSAPWLLPNALAGNPMSALQYV